MEYVEPERDAKLAREIFKTIAKAEASIAEGHGAIVRAMLHSMNLMLDEAAAAGQLATVQSWLEHQLDTLQFFVVAWRPGASPAAAAQEALEGRASGRVQ